jgi:lipid-A-disaccharide synthase
MSAQGGSLLKHYKEMAFMGFIPVLLNLRTILKNMGYCQEAIKKEQPDVVILIDYPGFNLKIAKYVKTKTSIPVYYYISPKVWAWKEYRVKSFRKYVDEMFCILPFEADFFAKHNYKVNYVGNPTVDEVAEYKENNKSDSENNFIKENNLSEKPIIALLAGSRKQEIKDNLPAMLKVLDKFSGYQAVIAGAPGIDESFYSEFINNNCKLVFSQTYRLLKYSKAALVTSGTATLETALFNIPQVVCYKTPLPRLVYLGFKYILHTKYISLVNLIADKTVVKELFAKFFTIDNISSELDRLLHDIPYRNKMLENYAEIQKILGNPGASVNAAKMIYEKLK